MVCLLKRQRLRAGCVLAGLQMSLSVEERLEVLLHVKWTVKQFDCQLTREIVELVDRESDLLNRGRSEKSVEGELLLCGCACACALCCSCCL